MRLAALFTDHAVMQQGKPIPVWGWDTAGQVVTVEFAGQSAQATAGVDGTWRATLPALAAGGPHTLTVYGSDTLTIRDVLVGEVWLCSGQSNMQMTLGTVCDAEAEVAAADYTAMRLFTVPNMTAAAPADDVQAQWSVCSPEIAGGFSAVGYFFGRELYRRLGVPVGLINSSWGGTIAEAWTSREGLLTEPALRDIVAYYERSLENMDATMAEYQDRLAAWEEARQPKDPGNTGLARGWAADESPDGDWHAMQAPQSWQNAGLDFSGVLWFRKEVEIPAAWAGRELMLSLGPCDKSDITYFNNVPVGGMSIQERADAWCQPRVYPVPGALVRAGKNLIAVRIFSHIYAGGFIGSAEQMHLAPAGLPDATPISLAGSWQYAVEHNFGKVPFAAPPTPPPGAGDPNSPFALYNGMIAPLVPFALRGAIWYQGESNAGQPYLYRTLFPALIRDWRRVWGQDDLAFHFVQLANYMARSATPCESRWAELREAQLLTLQLPHTGMAVAIDIGDGDDIHPRNKQDVGLRLALNALVSTYGQSGITPCGPLYASAQVEDAAVRLVFDQLGGGLIAQDGPLTGFAIAGDDRHFVWADAIIDGDTVVVSSPRVPQPRAVRYAWGDNPACNLYNRAGLPASPFRTDDWPIPGQ